MLETGTLPLASLPLAAPTALGALSAHTAPAATGAPTDTEAQRRERKAEEVGRRMEALFATMLVKELRKALPNEGFFGSGAGADTYNGWFDEHLGEVLARDGALDLAGRVKVALQRQEAAGGAA